MAPLRLRFLCTAVHFFRADLDVNKQQRLFKNACEIRARKRTPQIAKWSSLNPLNSTLIKAQIYGTVLNKVYILMTVESWPNYMISNECFAHIKTKCFAMTDHENMELLEKDGEFELVFRKSKSKEFWKYTSYQVGCWKPSQLPDAILSSQQVRSGQVRSGQVRSGQVRSGQVRSGQVRSGQVRLG